MAVGHVTRGPRIGAAGALADGAALLLHSTDGSQAMNDPKNAAEYKDRLEISKSERLTVQVIRGS